MFLNQFCQIIFLEIFILRYRFISFLLGLLCCTTVNAQQPYAIQLNNQNGLPSNTVFNIHQDKKGFIWIATPEGLFRYDGFEYKSYKSATQTSASGSDIKEDRYGRIWYENFDGFLYYVENESLKSLPQNTPTGYISYGITDKNLFVIQKKGIDIFDLDRLKLSKTIPVATDEAEHATTLDNDFYFISNSILYKIDADFKLTSTDFFKTKNLKIKYVYPFKKQLYVVSKLNEEKKIYFFDHSLKFTKSFAIPEISYFQGSNVIDNTIWLHSSKGIFAYDEFGKKLFKEGLFDSHSSSEIIKDHQNNYLFATTNNGILIVPELQDKIYPTNSFAPLKIIPQHEGYLIGTKKGELLQLDSNFSNKKTLHSIPENLPTYYLYEDKIDEKIVFSDNGFSIISKTDFAKIKNYNVALKEIIRLDNNYYAFAASGYCGLLKNPNAPKTPSPWDTLFTENIDPDYPEIARIKKGIRAKSVDYDAKKNTLFFATNIGLFTVTPDKQEEIKYNGGSFYAERIFYLDNAVYALDTKGMLFKIHNNHFENLNKKWRILDSEIRRIKKSGHEFIIVCKNFIYIFDTQSEQIRKIDFQIKGNQIYDIIKKDSHLIAVTDQGILELSLQAKRRKKEVLFHINDFLVNNKHKNLKELENLEYHENNIAIHFSVLEFAEKTTPVYYRINQEKWFLINKETRTIQFPSLSSGTYAIEFKIGEKISPEKINFEITLPFWKKWWFYLILSLLGGFLIYVYFKWQSKLMQNQIRLLNEKVILEKNLSKSMMASIKSQMNPHFFYNALNTIQAYIFTNDKQKANSYLAKFSKLTRIILEMSEKETISLNEEIEALRLYLDLEKMRFSGDFQYFITLKNIPDSESIELPPMLLQPYVENAIKHGLLHRSGDKNLIIDFELKEHFLLVFIDDNGIGRKRSEELNKIKEEKHQSFATQANEKRLEILNRGKTTKIAVKINDKHNSDGTANGTTVSLSIPVA